METHTNRITGAAAMAVRFAVIVTALVGYPGGASAQQVAAGSTIEVGPGAVSDDSFKAGEYNGLQSQGAFFAGNADLRSAARYDSESTRRWRIKGTDLGLDTRSAFATIGNQGAYRVNFAFDQLRRNRSDTYQTPLIGAGGGVLTLPSGWLVPLITGSTSPNARGLVPSVGGQPYISSGAFVQPSAAQLTLVGAGASADRPLFNNFDLFTRRTRFDGGFTYNVSPAWSVDANVRPEWKNGTKPMGTVSRNVGGDMSAIIPDPVDYTHDQLTTNVSYKNDKGFAQAGYYGSFFRNGITAVQWQNWASGPGPTALVNTITSPPGNNFNQVNATAGVNLTATTKITGNAAYSRGTQNDPYVRIAAATVVPVASLQGLVVTTSAYGKVTNRPTKKVNLSASYKFDDRNNQTPIQVYQFADAEETNAPNTSFAPTNPLGPLLSANANANRPYSRRLNALNTDAAFNVARGQWVKAGYDFEMIDRSCPGSWIACADAARTKENAAHAEWQMRATESVTARLTYAYGARRATYNEDAWLALVPYANIVPLGQTISAYQAMLQNGLTGYGPVAGYNGGVSPHPVFFPSNNAIPPALYANGGNRISELIGMRRYYVADRDRNRLRALATWQATEALAVQIGGDGTFDKFPNSRYGMQRYNTYAADADLTYTLADNLTANVFYTYEDLAQRSAGNTYTANSNTAAVNGATALSGNVCDSFVTMQERNNNNKLDPCLDWTSRIRDVAHTVGVGMRKVTGPLDLSANVIYTRQRWNNALTGGSWANNPLLPAGSPASAIAAYYIPAEGPPTVSADSTEVRLDGRYTVGKGAVRVSYAYLHMSNNDWMYEGMQFGTMSGVLPTGEQPFNYGVNALSIYYVFGF